MEYVDGEDLASLLRRIGRLPADKAAEMARRLCLGLAAAHQKGVLHRDLKPTNIMIDGRGHVLITDFGIAAFAGQFQGTERAGTAAYMAPEQLTGSPASIHSDLYSLGLVLFEMFTGKRPFEATSIQELVAARQARPLLTASVLVKDLDPAIDRIISKCLDPDPRARRASAFAIASAIPGEDALMAAVAAGQTPSPDMVAASGPLEGLPPRTALSCALSIVAALVLIALLSGRASLIERAHLERSADSLDESARRILRSVGQSELARDSAHGFFFTPAFLRYQNDRFGNRWDNMPAVAPQPIAFWYRESPTYLEPHSFMCCDGVPGGISLWEPAPQIPGERLLVLSTSGQLEHIEVLPPHAEDSSDNSANFDWNSAFAAAGIRMEDFQSVSPQWLPQFFADKRAAWLGSYPGGPSGSLRVEAASQRGRLVFFQTVTAFSRPGHDEPFQRPPAQQASDMIGVVLVTAVTTLGLWLALRNLRLRRVDRRGAFRLLAIGYVLDVFTWVLLGAHVPAINFEWRLLEMATSWALFRAAVLWLFYVALEPYVRRRWPHALISWSRLLAGHFRDAKVGGDVLIGVTAGCAAALLFQLYQALIKPWVDLGPLTALKGPRHSAGLWLADLYSSVVLAFIALLLFLLLRTVLRRQWLAVAAFGLVQGALVAFKVIKDGTIVGIQYLLVALFLVRFGFVTVATAIFVYTISVSFPITANVSSWYFGSSLFAMFSIALLAGLALKTTLAGRPLIKDELW
jgi:serine/threonine-protein kinase